MEMKQKQKLKLSSLDFNAKTHFASEQNVLGSDQLPDACAHEGEEFQSSEQQDEDNVFYPDFGSPLQGHQQLLSQPEGVREPSDIISAVNVLVQESSALALKTLQMDSPVVQKVSASAEDFSNSSKAKQKSSRSSHHQRFRDIMRIGKRTDTAKNSDPSVGSLGTQNFEGKSKNTPKLSSAFSTFVGKTSSTFGMSKKKKTASVSVVSGMTEHSHLLDPSKENVTQNLIVSDTVSFARSKSGPLPSISENLLSDIRTGESAASLGENICSSQSSGKRDNLKRKGSWLNIKEQTVSSLAALFHRRTKTKVAGSSDRPSGDELVDE